MWLEQRLEAAQMNDEGDDDGSDGDGDDVVTTSVEEAMV
jgi:hypothetical protein